MRYTEAVPLKALATWSKRRAHFFWYMSKGDAQPQVLCCLPFLVECHADANTDSRAPRFSPRVQFGPDPASAISARLRQSPRLALARLSGGSLLPVATQPCSGCR